MSPSPCAGRCTCPGGRGLRQRTLEAEGPPAQLLRPRQTSGPCVTWSLPLRGRGQRAGGQDGAAGSLAGEEGDPLGERAGLAWG